MFSKFFKLLLWPKMAYDPTPTKGRDSSFNSSWGSWRLDLPKALAFHYHISILHYFIGVMINLDDQFCCIKEHLLQILKHTSGCACEGISRDECQGQQTGRGDLAGTTGTWLVPSNRMAAWKSQKQKEGEAHQCRCCGTFPLCLQLAWGEQLCSVAPFLSTSGPYQWNQQTMNWTF